MVKLAFQFILLIFCMNLVSAATIYGSVYDLSLNKVSNAIVEVDSNPRQRIVAESGDYEFEIQEGEYRITAFAQDSNQRMSAEENISIVDEGVYAIDLFLYPVFDEENELYNDFEIDFDLLYSDTENLSLFWLLFPLAALMSVFLVILVRVNTGLIKHELEKEIEFVDDQAGRLLSLLKQNHGRMTQKDIRKEFPLSEAKISLLIAELESLGKIKKIKKGRGNIILLKK
ncbi:hypothetical protein JXC34_03790 [Candidatus Woesearchaeota archaeon]|nr:hypothetical protein [Candidatus Woesearchaeota archaeon]